MSAFKKLRDVSNNFEADLRKLSTELFCSKIGEDFEDCVVKRLRDLSLYKSKLRLLRAKHSTLDPRLASQDRDEATTLKDYEDTATAKVLEQQIVKFLTQSHSVTALITAPSSSLDPELVERKEKIIACMETFRQHECQLRQLQTVLTERQEQLDAVRREWDAELGLLRDAREDVDESVEESGPLHRKLRTLVEKMEMMRWLISKLATSRSGYDWLSDPQRRLRALQLARQPAAVEHFVEA